MQKRKSCLREKYSASYLGEGKKWFFIGENAVYIEKCFTNAFRDEHLTHTTTIKSFVKWIENVYVFTARRKKKLERKKRNKFNSQT